MKRYRKIPESDEDRWPEVEAEGRAAARDGVEFHECPYTFARAKVDRAQFEKDWRGRMNLWFRGWIGSRSN